MVLVGVDVAVSSVSSRIFLLGFMWSGVLRGLSLGSVAAASRCSSVYPDGSVPLGGVLARQAVGVLVGAALPGAVRVAEVHLHVERGGHACMQGEFGSLVPCRAVAQQCGR